MAEEGIRVSHGLLEGTRDCLLQHGTVVWPADRLHPGIDGPGLVARAVTLESGLGDGSDELSFRLAQLRRTRRFQQGEGLHHVRVIQSQLESDHGAAGVTDEVRSLDPKVVHKRPTVPGLLLDAESTRQTTAPRIADAMVVDYAVTVGEG